MHIRAARLRSRTECKLLEVIYMYAVVSRLVGARCLVCRVRCTFSLPLMLGFVYLHLPFCHQGLVWSRRCCSFVFCCLPLGSYVAMAYGVTCHRAQQQHHSVATQLHE